MIYKISIDRKGARTEILTGNIPRKPSVTIVSPIGSGRRAIVGVDADAPVDDMVSDQDILLWALIQEVIALRARITALGG